MSMTIGNPLGAYGQTGIENNQRTIVEMEANGAIAADDVVVFDVMTSTDELVSVHKADVDTDDPALIAGVAIEDAADGEAVKVCVFGPAIVSVGDGTVAAAELAGFHGSTDGAADGTAADATTVAGDSFGVFLSANEVPAADKAIVYVGKV